MESTEFQPTTATRLKRIAWLSSRNPNKVFHQLMHHFTEGALMVCFHELSGQKAVGIDRMSKSDYGEQLSQNIQDLIGRMKRMSYHPQPVREVLIPKEGKVNATRTLGISNFEDKLVQKMIQKVLESIYEPLFLECSYGFRPGRGCHDAIRALHEHLFTQEVETVIDVDLSNFFGTIDHKELEILLREKIKDEKFMRYIIRQFKAGILSGNELKVSDEGVAQGSTASPILSNIFAHYVIDQWFEKTVKKHCRGRVELFRYGDDSVICCRYQADAERVKQALAKRLAKYKLTLNREKTCCVSYSKMAYQRGEKQGTFDFLGFTFYLGRSRRGTIIPKIRTSGQRLRSKLKKVNQWAKAIRNQHPLKEIWRQLCIKLEGHIRYYGVSHNNKNVEIFRYKTERVMFKWLNRRSQKRSFNWEKFQLFLALNPLPPVKIYHKLF
jgi:group II intron reverse transcriptase/maturase